MFDKEEANKNKRSWTLLPYINNKAPRAPKRNLMMYDEHMYYKNIIIGPKTSSTIKSDSDQLREVIDSKMDYLR